MSKTFPQPFGKYILLQKIAMGGMAEIFRAKTIGAEGFEREVVIKRILPHFTEDEAFVNMFIDEATLAAKLNHANIVQIFDFDRIDDTYYIAMEYIEGKDLKKTAEVSRKEGKKPLTVPQCVRIIVEAAKGLHYAHTRKHKNKPLNLVHRDVSPHNIMVSYNGEVKLMDFGIAKAASRSTSTRAGTVKGKCAYMAPEQARGGELDGRTDLFALAVVFWELLTAERLFAGDSDFATLSNVLKCEVDPASTHNPAVSPELDEILLKALSKDPDDRYADVGEFSNALQRLLYSTVTDSGEVNLTGFMQGLFENDIRALAELQESEETVHIQRQSTDSTATATSPEEDSEAKTMALDAMSPGAGLDSEAATMALDTSSLTGAEASEDATMMAPSVKEATKNAKGAGGNNEASAVLNTAERSSVGDASSSSGMGKWIGIAAVLLVLVGGGFAMMGPSEKTVAGAGGEVTDASTPDTATDEKTVTFNLTPPNAVVYVNGQRERTGKYVGKTGDAIEVYAEFAGRVSPTEKLTVGENDSSLTLAVPEAPKTPEAPEVPSTVSISIQAPKDVNIRVADKELGKGNVVVKEAVVGNEILVVAYRDNGEPYEKPIQVLREGQVVVVPGTKVPEGRVSAKWTFTVSPADAKVLFQDKELTAVEGTITLEGIFVGETVALTASKSGYNTMNRSFEIKESTGTAKLNLSKIGASAGGYGFVTINAKPWADVYLRGKKLGTTPIRNVKVPTGRQTFKLKQLGNTRTVSLTIKKGKTAKKVVDMGQ